MTSAKRILVIDDDPDIAFCCETTLSPEGYHVENMPSAEEGEAAIRARRPDLVILDIMMEEADSGLRLAEIIARDFPGLPIIILSSIADACAAVFDAAGLPVAAIVEKPVPVKHLLDMVRRCLWEDGL